MKIQDIVYGLSDAGRVRNNNEDRFIAQKIWDDQHVLAVAIDGVGGQEGGEIAAEIAKNTIREYLVNNPNGESGRLLKEAVNDANNAIFQERQLQPGYANMSCVLTAAIIDVAKGTLNWCHVGDSRLYVFENGKLTKLSHDHSLVGYREEIGDLTEEEAMKHPQRNIINRDVGSAAHRPDDEDFIETGSYEANGKCMVLLCSDGLSDMLTSAQITACLNQGKTLKQKCESLVAEANDKGGEDNITVVLAKISLRKKKSGTAAATADEDELQEQEDEPVMDTLSIPAATQQLQEKPVQKRKYNYRSLMILVILLLAASLSWFYFRQQASPQVTNTIDTVRKTFAATPADSLYFALQRAQASRADSFSFDVDTANNTVQLSMPLVIYADSFRWIQNKILYIEPLDSSKTPVGLILSGKNVVMKNVVFRKFTADTVRVRKPRGGN